MIKMGLRSQGRAVKGESGVNYWEKGVKGRIE